MQAGRRRDEEPIELRRSEQVRDARGSGQAGRCDRAHSAGIGVGNGHDAHGGRVGQRLEVRPAHPAGADQAEPERGVAGCVRSHQVAGPFCHPRLAARTVYPIRVAMGD
jgi:hypothetical protein